MGEREIIIKLSPPAFHFEDSPSGDESVLLVRYEGEEAQTRKFSAGALAVRQSDLVDYHLNGRPDSADSVWAINKVKAPLEKEHRAAITEDARRSAIVGALKAEADLESNTERKITGK